MCLSTQPTQTPDTIRLMASQKRGYANAMRVVPARNRMMPAVNIVTMRLHWLHEFTLQAGAPLRMFASCAGTVQHTPDATWRRQEHNG